MRDREAWRSLIDYAQRCVEAESTKTLVPLDTRPGDAPWFPYDDPEVLVTGRADSIAAPAAVAHLGSRHGRGSTNRRSLVYGWPTVVMPDRSGTPPRLGVTPLFVVHLERTRVGGEWTLTARNEPELNLAALSDRPEAAEIAAEILALPLPFGDAAGVAETATEAARLLGFHPPALVPDMPERVDPTSKPATGVYNAAIFVSADSTPGPYLAGLSRELHQLRGRDDWRDTAAAWLLADPGTAARRPSAKRPRQRSPLAAPLRVNRSQEAALTSIRTEPLTVVTGPPGTGKSQLVVNAVANAWLDGDTVLVASTNNAAVDVPAERADRDILAGLLLRTGNRSHKQQVAALVSAARSAARKHVGPEAASARKRLEQPAARRADLLARIERLGDLDESLLERARERSEAHSDLLTATSALDPRTDELRPPIDPALLDQVRREARDPSADLADRLDRHPAHAVPVVLWPPDSPHQPTFGTDDVEEIRRQATALMGTGLFGFFGRRRLRRKIGCARDTPLDRIRDWALAEQTAAAKRRLTDALRCDAETSLDRLLDWIRAEQRLADADSAFEVARAERERIQAGTGDAGALMPNVDREWSEASLAAVRACVAERIVLAPPGALPAFGAVGLHLAPAVEQALPVFRGWACTALSAGGNFPLKAGLFDLVIVDEASQCSLAYILPLVYRAKRVAIVGDPNQMRPITIVGDAMLRRIASDTNHDEDDLRERGLHHKDGSAYLAFDRAADGPPHLLDEHYRCHPHIAKWFNEAFYGGDLVMLTDVARSAGRRALIWKDVSGDSRRPQSRGGWENPAQAKATVAALEKLIDRGVTMGVVSPYAAHASLIERYARRRIDEEMLKDAEFVCGTAHRLQGEERDIVIFSSALTPNMPAGAAGWIEQERNLLNVAVSRARRTLVVIGHPDLDARRSPTLVSLREHMLAVQKAEGQSGLASAPVRTDSDAELDGDHHLDARRRQRRNDRARDAVLAGLGWSVRRVPAWRCHAEAEAVAAEIASVLDRLQQVR